MPETLYQRDLPDQAATEALGRQLASGIQAPFVLYLSGSLGAGKSCLARAFLQALGVQGRIRSPTFTLVEPYALPGIQAYHLDLYRLSDPQELEFIGIADYVQSDSILLIEWPEYGQGWLPEPDLSLTLVWQGEGRRISLQAASVAGQQRLAGLSGSGSA